MSARDPSDDRDALVAENARLRAALEALAKHEYRACEHASLAWCQEWTNETVRWALAGSASGDGER